MGTIIKLGLVGLGALAFAAFKWQAKQKAMAQELAGGCVACGSARFEVQAGFKTCLECGYAGREDGGGQLAAHEIDSMYDHNQSDKRGW